MYTPANAQSLIARNAQTEPWVADAAKKLHDAALPWRAMSFDELWSLLFSHTLPRSWSVWSNGHCPACKQPVPMYNWVIQPFKNPWKLMCPHCKELFPKNDFAAYYESGLDQQNIFRYEKADAGLLFNAEHPDPADPLHKFGVDDGRGCPVGNEQQNLWRFVGTYLIYGRWKRQTVDGIVTLANAYAVTGDIDDARRAAILLHRVANLYRFFDHKTQSVVEEKYYTDGFVSTWHDACMETRWMATAYEIIRDAVKNDAVVADFLAEKARKHALDLHTGPGAICTHIEDGVFRTAIRERHKIHVNYPGREVTIMMMHNILGTPGDKKIAAGMLDDMIETATKVDGVTGEKGLNGYSGFVLAYMADYLSYAERAEPGTIRSLFSRHPKLRKTFRFHIDTWCLEQKYYPTVGDAGWFAAKDERYQPVRLDGASQAHSLAPSPYQFLADLYDVTGDEAYLQVAYHGNGHKLEGMPFDVFCADPDSFRQKVGRVISQHGSKLRLGNTIKDQWHLAILRSGEGEHERAAWMCYDTGGAHAHANCMNIGLFAKGLDLMPDMGYPTLQFDGFGVHFTNWYLETISHNTVVIDGKNQDKPWAYAVGNPATLWADGKNFAAVRASCVEAVVGGEALVASVIDVPSATLEHVGLYFNTPGRCYRVRVYTKPIGAPIGEAGWTLAFEDDFNRASLGSDWEVNEGEWRIVDGVLFGHGNLGCTRRFTGNHRMEFEASTDAETPCDLSATLATAPGGLAFRMGAFMGFGSNNNIGSKITTFNRTAARADGPGTKIVRGKRHAVRCEVDGELMRIVVDGQIAISYLNNEETLARKRAEIRQGRQYERTWARIDLSPTDSYYLDVFRVVGGHEHTKFQHSHFGTLSTHGLSLTPGPADYYGHKLMRNFSTDANAAPGWSAEFSVHDEYKYLPAGKRVFLRYTDLTNGASASVCEGWCVRGSYDSVDETWVPRLLVRRQNDAGGPALASTFISLAEAHEGVSQIQSVRHLSLSTANGETFSEANVCLEVTLIDGRRDVLVSMDVENPLSQKPEYSAGEIVMQRELGLQMSGELAWVRMSRDGSVESMSLSCGSFVRCAGRELVMPAGKTFVELN